MSEQKSCQSCDGPQNQCQDVYRQIGDAKGPSVALKAVVAFLLPIIVFIVLLLLWRFLK